MVQNIRTQKLTLTFYNIMYRRFGYVASEVVSDVKQISYFSVSIKNFENRSVFQTN